MKVFNLLIVTPEETIFEGEVSSLKSKTSHGDFQMLAGFEPFVATIRPSVLTIADEKGEKTSYAVSAGVIETKGDKVILCANAIYHADNIDLEKSEKAMQRAKERIASNDYEVDMNRAKLALERAKVRISLVK